MLQSDSDFVTNYSTGNQLAEDLSLDLNRRKMLQHDAGNVQERRGTSRDDFISGAKRAPKRRLPRVGRTIYTVLQPQASRGVSKKHRERVFGTQPSCSRRLEKGNLYPGPNPNGVAGFPHTEAHNTAFVEEMLPQGVMELWFKKEERLQIAEDMFNRFVDVGQCSED